MQAKPCCVQDDEKREALMADFEVGQLLQDRIVPRAVLYFTGDAIDDGDDDGEVGLLLLTY